MNPPPLHQTRRKPSEPRELALARWDAEGGAGPGRSQIDAPTGNGLSHEPPGASAEVVQLRIRVIALENLVITLLAEGPAQQIRLARSMALHVSPRPGFTHHRVTLHAATQMRHLIKRAAFFRGTTPRSLQSD
jgi:hypothetical protein